MGKFESLAFSYLGLPYCIFLVFWLEPWFGVALLVGLSTALGLSLPRIAKSSIQRKAVNRKVSITSLLIATLWIVGAGYLGVWFGWTPDWNDARADLLSILVHFNWPVDFSAGSSDSRQYLLSVPGFFLVPAGICKILRFNSFGIHVVLSAWILAGLALVFWFILQEFSRVREQLSALLLFVFFSGLDSVGALLVQDDPMKYLISDGHLEPWSGSVQFSSVTTLLYWVPHHAMSSWIGVALLYRLRKSSALIGITAVVVLFSFLWSTFSPVGLLLVAIVLLLSNQGIRIRDFPRSLPLVIVASVGVIPIQMYYSQQDWIPRELWWYFSQRAFLNFGIEEQSIYRIVAKYFLFVVLEFGIWVLVGLWLKVPRLELLLVGIMLLLISQIVSFGPSDFAMRVSIAPLFLMFVIIVRPLAALVAQRDFTARRAAILVLCCLMSWTGITEVVENFRRGPNKIGPPCIFGSCDSIWTPLEEGFNVSTDKPFLFRD